MLKIFFIIFLSLSFATGCGDLDPEMQDKMTVVLNMDFQKRSSSHLITSKCDKDYPVP